MTVLTDKFDPNADFQKLLDALPTSDFRITPKSVDDNGKLKPLHADLQRMIDERRVGGDLPGLPHLTLHQHSEGIRCMLRSGYVALKHVPQQTYTEGSLRWSWHSPLMRAIRDQFPRWSDCSSFATWCGEDGLEWLHLGDIFNGANFLAGYTGTLVQHGERVSVADPGSFVFWGSISLPYHVAVSIGNGRCISHGRPNTPEIVPITGATQFRRYI